MDKQFTVAGVSTLNSVTKYRVANSLKREAVLKKSKHTNIKLIELPNAMTKDEAFAFIEAHADFAAVAPKLTGGIAPKAEKPAKEAKAAW